MSMVEVHAEALRGASGPYHEFLLSFKASRPIVYGFIEGREDPSFYRSVIEHALPVGWSVRLIQSGNRDAVLSVLAQMPWGRFDRKQICFFVDRDLSDFLEQPTVKADNLYITDNYSIENDVVSNHVLERVLSEVFGATGLTSAEWDSIYSLFEANIAAFCEAFLPIMAQILIWRRAGRRAMLDDIKLGQMWSFSGARVCLNSIYHPVDSRLEYFAGAVKLSRSSDEDLYSAQHELIAAGEVKRFVSGKYLLWLFVETAAAIHRTLPNLCNRFTKPPKIKVTLGAGNAMIIIGPRAKPPASLVDFVSRNYACYVTEATSS